jgi:hypothetical protein
VAVVIKLISHHHNSSCWLAGCEIVVVQPPPRTKATRE